MISTRFIMRVGSREGSIKILIQKRDLKNAYDVAAPNYIVICSLVKYGNNSSIGFLHTL